MISAVRELSPSLGGARAACDALGLARATYYRAICPRASAPRQKPEEPLAAGRELKASECQRILDYLHSERFVDRSPSEVFYTLLDEGIYLASIRTFYRVLADHDEVRERRAQRRIPEYRKPELLATEPNQVWTWDITKLLGPAKWTYYYLYVIIDIYSRYVVGWMLAERESGSLAEELIRETCVKQNIERDQLTIHSDRGPAMQSGPVVHLMARLGITKSNSRPHVSNDNPFSESQFKTLKYHPGFPKRFGGPDDARAFSTPFFRWYNQQHCHSAIAFLTPETVHYGLATEVLDARQARRLEAYEAHPERFINGPPRPLQLPAAVYINPPVPLSPAIVTDLATGYRHGDGKECLGKTPTV